MATKRSSKAGKEIDPVSKILNADKPEHDPACVGAECPPPVHPQIEFDVPPPFVCTDTLPIGKPKK